MTQNKKLIAQRDFLKSNWDVLDFDKSDQTLKMPFPALEKQFDPKKGPIPLIPVEKCKSISKISLKTAILNRQSRRKYTDETLSLEELSFLLYSTQGVRKKTEKYSLRTVPSGGARHPFETYLFIWNVAGLDKGIYRYLPLEHALYKEQKYIKDMEKKLHKATLEQFWKPAVYFIWTAVPYRTEWRYIGASAKLIALDAGHLCQNLYLACEAVKCGTCGIGAYDQKLIDKFLKVDGKDEFAVYMAPVGKV
jgi:SagB-type dehydrogenase family enzyme